MRRLLRALVWRHAFRGKSRAINAFERAASALGSQGPLSVWLNGFPLELDMRLAAHRDMYYGLYEEAEVRFMLRCLRPDSVLFDVGAAGGYYVARAAEVIGTQGSIHCFEPLPTSFELLQGRVATAELRASVVLNPVAVSDRSGECTIEADGGRTRLGQAQGLPLLQAAAGTRSKECHAVEATTLDDYVRQRRLGRVDFIKLDVEGHELAALMGFGACFERGLRPALLTEVRWDTPVEQRKALFSYLGSFGYRAYGFRRGRTFSLPGPSALGLKLGEGAKEGHTSVNVAWVCTPDAREKGVRVCTIGCARAGAASCRQVA